MLIKDIKFNSINDYEIDNLKTHISDYHLIVYYNDDSLEELNISYDDYQLFLKLYNDNRINFNNPKFDNIKDIKVINNRINYKIILKFNDNIKKVYYLSEYKYIDFINKYINYKNYYI